MYVNSLNMEKLDLTSNKNLESINLLGGTIETLDISQNNKITYLNFANADVKIDTIKFGDLKFENLTQNLFNLYGPSGWKPVNIYFNKTDYWQDNLKYLFDGFEENKYYDKDGNLIEDIDSYEGTYIKAVGKNFSDYSININIYISKETDDENSTNTDTKNTSTSEKKEENPKTTICINAMVIVFFISGFIVYLKYLKHKKLIKL